MFFLDHFVENYSGKDFTTDDLMKDEVIARLIGPVPEELLDHAKELQEKTVKKSTKKSTKQDKPKKEDKPKKSNSPRGKSLEDRGSEDVNVNKCQCRLWKTGGYDNIQCSGNKVDGSDFCSRHIKFGSEWWCGLITEKRPEEPIGPSTKPIEERTRHYWHDQERPSKRKKKSEENKPLKKTDTPVKKDNTKVSKKKKRKQPKKESDEKIENKNQEPDTDSDNEDPDIKIAGGVGEIPDKISEKNDTNDDDELPDVINSSDDEEDTEVVGDFEIDGVIYKRLSKDDMIMDWKTGTQMAYLKDGKFTEFFNEDAKQLHEFNKI